MNQRILLEKSIAIGVVHAHHELQIVDDHMLDVVNGHGVAHGLQRTGSIAPLWEEIGWHTDIDDLVDALLPVKGHEEHR